MMSPRSASILVVVMLYFLMILTVSPGLQAQTVNITGQSTQSSSHHTPNVSVFSSDSKPYNFTYGEWTARWWQWGYSIPKNINPAYDNTGKNCAQNQNEPVWFLAGTYGHFPPSSATFPSIISFLLR